MSIKIPIITFGSTEAFQTSKSFERFIHETYKSNPESMKLILKRITIESIVKLVSQDDQYFQSAADNLSYESLAFLAGLKIAGQFGKNFGKNSNILKTFLEKLQADNIDSQVVERYMNVLYEFNSGGLMRAVTRTRDEKLVKALKTCKKTEHSNNFYIYDGEDNDKDNDGILIKDYMEWEEQRVKDSRDRNYKMSLKFSEKSHQVEDS